MYVFIVKLQSVVIVFDVILCGQGSCYVGVGPQKCRVMVSIPGGTWCYLHILCSYLLKLTIT